MDADRTKYLRWIFSTMLIRLAKQQVSYFDFWFCSHNCRVSWICPRCRVACSKAWSKAHATVTFCPLLGTTRCASVTRAEGLDHDVVGQVVVEPFIQNFHPNVMNFELRLAVPFGQLLRGHITDPITFRAREMEHQHADRIHVRAGNPTQRARRETIQCLLDFGVTGL